MYLESGMFCSIYSHLSYLFTTFIHNDDFHQQKKGERKIFNVRKESLEFEEELGVKISCTCRENVDKMVLH